jgi:DNA-directed RNA polymerase specialized sigma24 family protein
MTRRRFDITTREIETIDNRESLKQQLDLVPPPLKRILLLRYFGSMTDEQVCKEMKLSQAELHRLVSAVLIRLQIYLNDDSNSYLNDDSKLPEWPVPKYLDDKRATF